MLCPCGDLKEMMFPFYLQRRKLSFKKAFNKGFSYLIFFQRLAFPEDCGKNVILKEIQGNGRFTKNTVGMIS